VLRLDHSLDDWVYNNFRRNSFLQS